MYHKSVVRQHSSHPFTANVASCDTAEQINANFENICQRVPSLDTCRIPASIPPPSPLRYINIPLETTKLSLNLARPSCSIISTFLTCSESPFDWKTTYVSRLLNLTTVNVQMTNAALPLSESQG